MVAPRAARKSPSLFSSFRPQSLSASPTSSRSSSGASSPAGSKNKSGPLAGIRVIECAHYVAGPLGGRLLADQGAECIKVESAEGDPSRQFIDVPVGAGRDISTDFHLANRGKRSIRLNY